MHKNVEILIGRLATDARLRSRFVADRVAFLGLLREQGLELTDVELAALAATDPSALRSFAGSLDPRLRKAPLLADAPVAGAAPRIQPLAEKETDR